jgi:5'-nucleotidase
VHINDVYEIQPVEGGKSGGLARVATLVERIRKEHPSVITTLGGDYLSPSAIGTANVDGEPLGRASDGRRAQRPQARLGDVRQP